MNTLVKSIILSEITRAEAEGLGERLSETDELKAVVSRYVDVPMTFVSMVNVKNKLGLVPRGVIKSNQGSFNTPLGIYGYPLGDSIIVNQLLGNALPFGKDRNFAVFFKFKEPDKVTIFSDCQQTRSMGKR